MTETETGGEIGAETEETAVEVEEEETGETEMREEVGRRERGAPESRMRGILRRKLTSYQYHVFFKFLFDLNHVQCPVS